MIKVDMSSPDLDKQIELLKYYPEFFKKHFRPTLYRNVVKGKQLTAAGVPKRTGRAAAALRSKVTGTGVNMEGHFGWYGNDMPWYINVVEYGAKPHPLNSGVNIHNSPKRRALFEKYYQGPYQQGVRTGGQHVLIGGKWVTMQIHKGFAGRKFMAAAYAALKPSLDMDLLTANEAVLKELEVT